jgi:hypothetical protein
MKYEPTRSFEAQMNQIVTAPDEWTPKGVELCPVL